MKDLFLDVNGERRGLLAMERTEPLEISPATAERHIVRYDPDDVG
jgi:hypothetical protein